MRAFAAFVLAIGLAGVLGAALAYPAYLLTSSFADWAFHRVASRLAMVVLALELIWLCRRLGLRTRRDLGFGLPRARFLRVGALGAALGLATAGLGAAFLLGSGLRAPDPAFTATAGSVLRLLLLALSSGLAVALLEETVMRGAMHTAVDRESGPWAAVLLIAPLFALLHFFARVHLAPASLHFASGFELLALSFAPLAHPALVFDAFLSWLAVGLILGLTRALSGNTATALGLHAGWVMVLRTLQETSVPGDSPAFAFWVGRFDGLLGYWLLPWAAGIGALLWFGRARWVPYASGASRSSRSIGSSSSR